MRMVGGGLWGVLSERRLPLGGLLGMRAGEDDYVMLSSSGCFLAVSVFWIIYG